MKSKLDIGENQKSSNQELTESFPSMKISFEHQQFVVVGKGYFVPCSSFGDKSEKIICESGDGLCSS